MQKKMSSPVRLVILAASLLLGWVVAQLAVAADSHSKPSAESHSKPSADSHSKPSADSHSKPSADQGWTALFDGDEADIEQHWNAKPGGWVVEDGTLARRKGGGCLWSKDSFGDFVLDLEVKMSDHCNSGIFFRGNPKNPVQDGFEIQVLDSHGKQEPDKHDFGALYDAKQPSKNVCRAPGEWNHVTLTCKGPKITVVANGEQIVDVDIDQWDTAHQNPDGSRNKFNRPLAAFPRKGHIGFQDHGHPVWYRNVRIRPLD